MFYNVSYGLKFITLIVVVVFGNPSFLKIPAEVSIASLELHDTA